MTTTEMKQILADKLKAEATYFTKSDISIKKLNSPKYEKYQIIIKDYEHCPFTMYLEHDDYFGYIVTIMDIDHEEIAFINSKKGYDIKTALLYLGYHIGNTF